MSNLRTAAQQALEYMKSVGGIDMYPEEWAIVERLEAALAEPESPLGQASTDVGVPVYVVKKAEPQEQQCNPHPEAPHGFLRNASHTEGRYVCACEFWTAPVQDRKPLNEEEIEVLAKKHNGIFYDCDIHFARAVEAAHGIGGEA
jgi:hypothetical protein